MADRSGHDGVGGATSPCEACSSRRSAAAGCGSWPSPRPATAPPTTRSSPGDRSRGAADGTVASARRSRPTTRVRAARQEHRHVSCLAATLDQLEPPTRPTPDAPRRLAGGRRTLAIVAEREPTGTATTCPLWTRSESELAANPRFRFRRKAIHVASGRCGVSQARSDACPGA